MGNKAAIKLFVDLIQVLVLVTNIGVSKVSGSFNIFMDRDEVHRLLGLSSDIYLVREGVVNEYALNFVVNIPSHIEQLHFKWQSLIKKPVHYEMVIEFADFFALLQPSSNISNVGRVPQQLQSFRVNLPCSGRLATEVPVIFRFTFHVKHTKHNVTVINVKRNKICLFKDQPGVDTVANQNPENSNSISHHTPPGFISPNSSTNLLFPNGTTSPSLLLAGLLGACAVTAAIVSVIFFICLRRKLLKLDSATGQSSSTSTNCSSSGSGKGGIGHSKTSGGNCIMVSDNHIIGGLSTSNSPACLIRHHGHENSGCGQNIQPSTTNTNWISPSDLLKFNCAESLDSFSKDKFTSSVSRSGQSPNSYVTIASFWNDILATNTTANKITSSTSGHQGIIHSDHTHHHRHQNFHHLAQQMSSNKNNNCHPARANSSKSHFTPSNSTFSSNECNNSHVVENTSSGCGGGSTGSHVKGSDVSPYAYAQIIAIPPPLHLPPSAPPPLIEWYSQFPVNNLSGGGQGHIYENNLCTTFNPSPNNILVQKDKKSPKCFIGSETGCGNVVVDGNCSAVTTTTTDDDTRTGNSESGGGGGTLGSGSLIQIDGFQCRKNFSKETNIVERFL